MIFNFSIAVLESYQKELMGKDILEINETFQKFEKS
jgi:hypothetical protein